MKKYFNDYMNNKFKLENYQKFGVFAFILFVSGLFGWIYEFVFYFLNLHLHLQFYRSKFDHGKFLFLIGDFP